MRAVGRPARAFLRQSGFSLLELLIAVAIMAMSLAVLYRVMGGSMRTAGVAERQQYALVLAESLLGSHDFVEPEGWNESGETDGMAWMVRSVPFATSVSNESPNATPLHEVSIVISWGSGAAAQTVGLSTLRGVRKPTTIPRR